MIIITLPLEVLRQCWLHLNVTDVCRVDSAITNKTCRKLLHNSFVGMHTTVITPASPISNGFWKWILSRQIVIVDIKMARPNKDAGTLERIARNCVKLQSLSLNNCNISNAGLLVLATGCPDLRNISLVGSASITEMSDCQYYHLVVSKLPQLTLVNVKISLTRE
jgi:hypothetical protein